MSEIRAALGLPPVDPEVLRKFGPPTYTENQVLAYAAALAPTKPPETAGEDAPVAWLKEWTDNGEPRVRVDMRRDHEPWLERLNPKVTPLGRIAPTKQAAVSDGVKPNCDRCADTGIWVRKCVGYYCVCMPSLAPTTQEGGEG